MSIAVYHADVSPLREPALFQKIYNEVSPERQQKVDRIRFDKDKRLSLGAEYLFMEACKDFGLDYAKIQVQASGIQKPYMEASELCFNLSHSGNQVMCVMAQREVGCDVEEIRPCNFQLADRFFAPEEQQALARCSTEEEKQRLFFRIWTLKESYIKCTGQGLGQILNVFSVITPKGELCSTLEQDGKQYQLMPLEFQKNYCYALCYQK